jgi:oligoendopeptidase F
VSATALPTNALDFMDWPWSMIEPYYRRLATRSLGLANLYSWLSDWSHLRKLVDESYARLQLENARNTADEAAEKRYHAFLENVYPSIQAADQVLKEKLLASGLQPDGFEVPLRNLRAEADLFREANLPLMTEEQKLGSEYNKVVGAQTVAWEGEEVTLQQLRVKAQTEDRGMRERLWRLASERQLADRQAINSLWMRFMGVRRQLAANAGLPDYRAYRWQQQLRFDYTPQDCRVFHRAIEQAVVPVAARIYAKHCRRLGIKGLRPWDLEADVFTLQLPALHAYDTAVDLGGKTATVFRRVDPRLGNYFDTMSREGLLDLDNRKGKAPGAFCTSFAMLKRPFVFMNGVGMATDVRTVLHECGHAFHVFERSNLPYHHQWRSGMEFNEVASMAMELLAAPYLEASEGGFFSKTDAARDRIQHLERILLFWPYMAVVDAFQHWVYENHAAATDPVECDAQWAEQWRRFIPSVDWSGLDDALVTGWHRKLHIHRYPFYYVEYGLAQLGAVQVWRNALQDQAEAVRRYLEALALGGTVPLPELYQAAGATLAFDAATLREAVDLVESTIEALEASI